MVEKANTKLLLRSLIQAIKDDNAKFKAIEWTEEMENDFNTLKKILMTEPVMAHPDFTKKFYIHVDASGLGLGAILTQLHDGKHRVIEYASKKLTQAQTKYSNPAHEGLGIVWALNHFKYYVYGRSLIVYCDCEALTRLMKKGSTTIPDHVKLRDWCACIMEYDIDMKHKPGRMMVIPDNLSRNFIEYAETEQDFETKKLQDLLYKALGRKPMYENREVIENEKEMQKQEDGIERIQIRNMKVIEKQDKEDKILSQIAVEQRTDKSCKDLIDYLLFRILPKISIYIILY